MPETTGTLALFYEKKKRFEKTDNIGQMRSF
mgnify:FL=1